MLAGPAESGGEEEEGMKKDGGWPPAHVGNQEGGGRGTDREREQIRGNPEKEVLFPASAHGPVPSRWHDRGYIRQDDADRKLIVPPSTESDSVQARAQVVEVTRKKYSRVTAEF